MDLNHYKYNWLSWIFKPNSVKKVVFDITGMNLYNIEVEPIFLIVVGIYSAVTMLITGVILEHYPSLNPNFILFAPLILIRLFYPPTPYKTTHGNNLVDRLSQCEFEKHGCHMTPRWFFFVWYGILRVGRWSSGMYWVGLVFQWSVFAALCMININAKDVELISLFVVLSGIYLHMVYRNEF